MRLYSCWFRVPTGVAWPATWYERHARVLEYSALKNTPGWAVHVRQIADAAFRAARCRGNASSYSYNTHKLMDWEQVVREAPEGEQLLICDADLMVLRPLDPIWDLDFDVAITEKRGLTKLPLNGGVVFLRVNARSRAWFAAWLDWNMRLLANGPLHDALRRKYAGMNQAALGGLIESGDSDRLAFVREIPCREWNCESATWRMFDETAPPRIVHVKGALRRALMDPRSENALADPQRKAIAAIWRQLERDAVAQEARRA